MPASLAMPPLDPSRDGVTCGPAARAVHPQLPGLGKVPDFPVKPNTGHRTLHHLVRVRFWSLRRSVDKLTPPAGKPSVTVRFLQCGRAVIPEHGRQTGAVRARRDGTISERAADLLLVTMLRSATHSKRPDCRFGCTPPGVVAVAQPLWPFRGTGALILGAGRSQSS